jgi:hypothetical protein
MDFFRGVINALLIELAAVALVVAVVWIVRWIV